MHTGIGSSWHCCWYLPTDRSDRTAWVVLWICSIKQGLTDSLALPLSSKEIADILDANPVNIRTLISKLAESGYI